MVCVFDCKKVLVRFNEFILLKFWLLVVLYVFKNIRLLVKLECLMVWILISVLFVLLVEVWFRVSLIMLGLVGL